MTAPSTIQAVLAGSKGREVSERQLCSRRASRKTMRPKRTDYWRVASPRGPSSTDERGRPQGAPLRERRSVRSGGWRSCGSVAPFGEDEPTEAGCPMASSLCSASKSSPHRIRDKVRRERPRHQERSWASSDSLRASTRRSSISSSDMRLDLSGTIPASRFCARLSARIFVDRITSEPRISKKRSWRCPDTPSSLRSAAGITILPFSVIVALNLCLRLSDIVSLIADS